jgi:hypothetical protein
MKRLTLTIAALMAIVTAMLAPSFVARAQSGPRFDYLRVVPYRVVTRTPGHITGRWAGYRACLAGSTEWTCREFEPMDNSDTGLRTTLATLGDEGWELVSAVDERHDVNSDFGGLTYLFKRQRQ